VGSVLFRETSQAKMNNFARRWSGAGILGTSILVGLYLHLSGVPLQTLVQSQTETSPDGRMMWTVAEYKTHWPLMVLYITGALGLCLLLIPSKKRIPPIIRPKFKD
jgi:hypothetical protein